MRRRVSGSYANESIGASKSARALCSAGMIAGRNEAQRCRESGSAMIDVRDDLDELEQSRAERAQRAQPESTAKATKLAHLYASSRSLFHRITPQSPLSEIPSKPAGVLRGTLLRGSWLGIAIAVSRILAPLTPPTRQNCS